MGMEMMKKKPDLIQGMTPICMKVLLVASLICQSLCFDIVAANDQRAQ